MLLAKYLFYISCFSALLYSVYEYDGYPIVIGALCIRDTDCCLELSGSVLCLALDLPLDGAIFP